MPVQTKFGFFEQPLESQGKISGLSMVNSVDQGIEDMKKTFHLVQKRLADVQTCLGNPKRSATVHLS